MNSHSQRDAENGKVQATEIRSLDRRAWLLDNLLNTFNVKENICFRHQYKKIWNFLF